jgi:hypothetical protein
MSQVRCILLTSVFLLAACTGAAFAQPAQGTVAKTAVTMPAPPDPVPVTVKGAGSGTKEWIAPARGRGFNAMKRLFVPPDLKVIRSHDFPVGVSCTNLRLVSVCFLHDPLT